MLITYISHLHTDHFDPEFLSNSSLNKKKFIIKKYKNRILAKRLLKLGAEKIIELESFTIFDINGKLSVTIVPQLTSNSEGVLDDVNYDLDTSIIIGDGDYAFFNQVDNPLSLKDFEVVSQFVKTNYNQIDIACLHNHFGS